MASTQGVVCLQNVLVQGVSITCPVLTTECLTKNVAHNPSTRLFISLYYVIAIFILLRPFGARVFKQIEIKCDDFQQSLEVPPNTILCFCLLFLPYRCLFCLIILTLNLLPCNVQTCCVQEPNKSDPQKVAYDTLVCFFLSLNEELASRCGVTFGTYSFKVFNN